MVTAQPDLWMTMKFYFLCCNRLGCCYWINVFLHFYLADDFPSTFKSQHTQSHYLKKKHINVIVYIDHQQYLTKIHVNRIQDDIGRRFLNPNMKHFNYAKKKPTMMRRKTTYLF